MKELILRMIKAHLKGLSIGEINCLVKDIEILIKMDRKEKLEDRK